MRINILTSRFPYPLEKGDKLRIYHQIKLLSRHHELFLFSIDSGRVSDSDLKQLSAFCSSVKIYKLPALKRFWTVLAGLFHGLPVHVGYFYDSSLRDQIIADMQSTNADLTLGQLIRVAPYLAQWKGRVWIDFMDSFSGNLERRLSRASWPEKLWLRGEVKKISNIETKTLKLGDVFSIISEQDRLEVDPADEHAVTILPNGVDTEYFYPRDFRDPQFDICFTGNLGYEPNIKAANYLIRKIGPKLDEDYTIRIAGARPNRSLLKLSDSKYHISGWVDDIREVYWSGKIFVAPLFTGSGQQNKILEAMACGIPVITTSLVNNAIGAEPGKEILIADDLKSFLIQIDSLKDDEDLLEALSENAREFVELNYNWEKIGDLMEAFLKNLK